uniref:Uncharacterized protein n=1 Tax=Alexandrium monilatum TaxID=311494 RepID=A0A7S4RVB6_9DINO
MAVLRLLVCSLLVLLSLATRTSVRKGHAARSARQPEGGDEYEYGDRESEVSHGDASDFSVHQFLVDDDARDGSSSTDGDRSIATEMARQRAYAAADHFNSEDTPDNSDSFAQTRKATKARATQRSSSKHKRQFPESGDQYEYGDRESRVSQGDAADYSIHQFLVDDDARDGASSTAEVGASESVARDKALAADDHFNSEDTPDHSDSFAQLRGKSRKAEQTPDDEGEDEFEYGDRERQVSRGDAADFSVAGQLGLLCADRTQGAQGGGAEGEERVQGEAGARG